MSNSFLKFVFTSKRVLWLLVLWQLISVMLMAMGVWPYWVVWVNVAASALFLLLASTHDGVLFLLASVPFFVALPNPYVAGLPSWRLLFVWLFVLWLARTFIAQRKYFSRLLHFRRLRQESKLFAKSKIEFVETSLGRVDSRFMPWDKYLALFALVALVSVIFAHFKVQAIKQIIFLLNIYIFYIVLINAATTRQRVVELIKYAAFSAGSIVLLGYVQFVATLFVPPYYFWQYWATMVSRLYYGLPLANVLIYSNSWFSYSGGQQELRMFSIMPDSHSFGMIAVFAICFFLPLLAWYKPINKLPYRPWLGVFSTRNYYIWYAVRFAGLAVILSGTRGIWVGMAPPLLLASYLYYKKFARGMMKKVVIAEVLIILLFLASPFINFGLNWIRVSRFKENFLQRAESIYDLSEESNAGRLIIWRDSSLFALTHPFGIGYGNFVVSLVPSIPPGMNFAEVANQKNLRYNLPQKFVSAHSLYLNVLVELGFAGILAFAVFWWEYFAQAWRFVRKHSSEENIFTMFVVSSAFTMLWFLFYGVFDVTLLNDKVLVYFFVALGVTGIILRRYEGFEKE